MIFINLNKYTINLIKQRNKALIKKVNRLEDTVTELRRYLEDGKDNDAGYIQQIQKLEGIIRRIKKAKYHIPNSNNIIKETVLAPKTYKIPSDFQWEGNQALVVPVIEFHMKKNYKYVVTCHTENSHRGKQDILFMSSRSSNLTDYIGDVRVLITPRHNQTKLVQFLGKQIDDSHNNQIHIAFKALQDSEIYFTPVNRSTLYDLGVVSYHYPYNIPDFPNDNAIELPHPNHSDPNSKLDPTVLQWLESILDQLKKHEIDVTKVFHTEDENGNISYRFTADLVQHQWNFVQAVNKLNYHNGMARIGATRDSWIELDANDDLVVKYAGNDRLFDYQPSKEDIDANDWVVENNRPFNPDDKPVSSDPRDDSRDTDKYNRYDVNTDPYLYKDYFNKKDNPDDNGDWSNTDFNQKD